MIARICLFVFIIALLTGCAQYAQPVSVAKIVMAEELSPAPIVSMKKGDDGTYYLNLNGNLAKGEAYYVTIIAFKIEEDYGQAVDFGEWLIRGNSFSYKPIADHEVFAWDVTEVVIVEFASEGLVVEQVSYITKDDTLGDYIQDVLDRKYGD